MDLGLGLHNPFTYNPTPRSFPFCAVLNIHTVVLYS
jgi:hypothetical protein